jgi:hypothetical protein
MTQKNSIGSLVESLLSKNTLTETERFGIVDVAPTFIQNEPKGLQDPDEVAKKEDDTDVWVVLKDGEVKWEGPAADKGDALKKAEAELGYDLGGNLKIEKREATAPKALKEDFVKLSPKSVRSLYNAHLAERMMNEEIVADDDLVQHGLLTEEDKKLTKKGREWLKGYLPTIYNS